MTDKEMAEEYAFTHYGDTDNDGNPLTDDVIMQQAYLAGLKAGRPQWHDVLKDPTDLPKVNDQYWVCYEDSVNIGRKGHEMWVFIDGKWEHTAKVIDWCEMPKYTEEV